MLALRFAPTPIPALNYFYGLTSISVRDFVLATLIGYTPGTLLCVASGVGAHAALSGGGSANSDDVARPTLLSAGARAAIAQAARGAQPWWW